MESSNNAARLITIYMKCAIYVSLFNYRSGGGTVLTWSDWKNNNEVSRPISPRFLCRPTTLYSYWMGVDAIDQSICPGVLGMTKCSIAWGLGPNAIEHLVIPSIIFLHFLLPCDLLTRQ